MDKKVLETKKQCIEYAKQCYEGYVQEINNILESTLNVVPKYDYSFYKGSVALCHEFHDLAEVVDKLKDLEKRAQTSHKIYISFVNDLNEEIYLENEEFIDELEEKFNSYGTVDKALKLLADGLTQEEVLEEFYA